MRILEDLEADEVANRLPTFLVLATTFLVQDWTKSEKTCCTEVCASCVSLQGSRGLFKNVALICLFFKH